MVLFPGSVVCVCKEGVLSIIVTFEAVEERKYDAIWGMGSEISGMKLAKLRSGYGTNGLMRMGTF